MTRRTIRRDQAKRLVRRSTRRAVSRKSRKAAVRFEKGGVPNSMAAEIWEAMRAGCERVGSDGAGTDGLIGYCSRLALNEPRTMGTLIYNFSLLLFDATVCQPQKAFETREEIIAAMRARGIPYERFFPKQSEHDDDLPEPDNDGPAGDPKGEA